MASLPDPVVPAVYHLPRLAAGGTELGAVPDRVLDEWIDQLVQQNEVWYCRLRWIVITVLTAAGVLGYVSGSRAWLGVRLTPGWPLATAAFLTVVNLGYWAVLSRDDFVRSVRVVRRLLWVQIVVDLTVLTVVIHFLGSTSAFAPFTYLFHLVLSCIFFTPGQSFLLATIAATLYVSCLVLEALGVFPAATVFMQPELTPAGPRSASHWVIHLGSVLLIWGVIWYLTTRLAGRLWRREYELAAANLRLKLSSEERALHMLQTTHQLKAPFAAIHAMTQLLVGSYCGELPTQALAIMDRISARCAVLSQQIQDMLHLANLRSESQSVPVPRILDLSDIIEATVSRLEPLAARRSIEIFCDVQPSRLLAVEDHMRMLVDNLLTNAVNYSYDGGTVRVSCRPAAEDGLALVIQDQGIGIAAEKLPHIFEDFFRTSDASRHLNSSTGLGLAIVRHVAHQADIDVKVESAPGWGTRMSLRIPRGPLDDIPSEANEE